MNIALDDWDSSPFRYAAPDWLNGRMWVVTSYQIYNYDIIV